MIKIHRKIHNWSFKCYAPITLFWLYVQWACICGIKAYHKIVVESFYGVTYSHSFSCHKTFESRNEKIKKIKESLYYFVITPRAFVHLLGRNFKHCTWAFLSFAGSRNYPWASRFLEHPICSTLKRLCVTGYYVLLNTNLLHQGKIYGTATSTVLYSLTENLSNL